MVTSWDFSTRQVLPTGDLFSPSLWRPLNFGLRLFWFVITIEYYDFIAQGHHLHVPNLDVLGSFFETTVRIFKRDWYLLFPLFGIQPSPNLICVFVYLIICLHFLKYNFSWISLFAFVYLCWWNTVVLESHSLSLTCQQIVVHFHKISKSIKNNNVLYHCHGRICPMFR